MKYLFLILVALFTSYSFTSCTPEAFNEQIELSPTEGDDGEVEDEDDDGTGN